ncbi:transient receptor potential cation channel subfamily A member 1b isoform X4 [Myripristis murdjan]|uniref:transient receptor potential cation channel subfamily A member 1b isoform X4 n=1 Tax=Myripristis murdjan TaxID=586833 RepID=UPI00117611B8|nr:transient receptor potential cation channel subfamily A member 1 isoform X4 [Myripristis murdjan]
MNFSRDVARQNSCYTYVIEDEDPALARLNVFELAEKGDLALLESLVRKNPEVLSERDESGASPLHHAAAGGHVTFIQFITTFIDSEGVNSCDWQGSVPLHWAVERNQAESCRALMDLGANPNILNMALMSPLHLAVSHGHNNLVELLLSYSATDCNLQGDLGNTPMMLGCSINNCEALSILLKHGARLCQQNKLGHFPIHAAAFAGAKKAMEVILKAGEEVGHTTEGHINYQDKSMSSPLHLAVRGGNIDAIRLCIVTGAKIDQQQVDRSTALHFACTQGATEVVKLMLSSYHPVEDIINLPDGACQTPLHRYGRINTCHRLLETMKDSRLVNEGDERGLTPLHLASAGGHTKVVELLLRKGALFHCDYKGWSCLHHAASAGYTQTMNILLSANVKLLDKTDEDGNTALHIAAREGHVAAVKLMLCKGAELVLNKNHTSFLHEALQNGRKDVVNAVIDSERCAEALKMFKHGAPQKCPILAMIEILPETFKHLLDRCVRESDDDPNSPDYSIEYNFMWLQAPIAYMKNSKTDNAVKIQPLVALNAMVQYNRIELLNHPVCRKYLEMKWLAYGSKAHFLNMFIYLLGLLPLTYLIVTLRPTLDTSQGNHNITMVPINLRQQNVVRTICMAMVLVMNIYAIGKEVVQISQQGWNYLKDYSNSCDWFAAIFSLLFVIPLFLSADGSLHWQAGAMAVFQSWVGFLLYLQRFEHFGIYVVMFGEIMKTLVRIVMLFLFLMVAFSLAFYALMLNQREFKTVELSLAQTFVMMVGELNYQNNFLDALLSENLPFPGLTYFIFINFVLLMPILLVNLMIGLAVGDIAEVQRNASLKRIAMQIDLHTALEDKLPYWFMKRVDKPFITIYPNRKCSRTYIKLLMFWDDEDTRVIQRLQTSSHNCTPIDIELQKQKNRLKEMSSMLEKQHNLLKLIIQKMEITSEADEYDGPVPIRGSMWSSLSQRTSRYQRVSRWVPLMKAIEAKRK